MQKLLLLILAFGLVSWQAPQTNKLKTLFETSGGMQSAPYHEGIAWWQKLAKMSPEITMEEFGMTDAGYPLHLVTLSKERTSIQKLAATKKTIILINNAIHPGEPDGVDASMMLFRDIAAEHRTMLDNCIVVCIPYYNIGGALNRNGTSRANQEGPEEYGFRGNAQNLDLNRDFVKCDSRNAESFAKLLQLIDPDMYVETHVSNGADYQYTMTYLSTQPDKLGGEMGSYLRNKIIPDLEANMLAKGNEMVPYVNHWGGPLKDSYATFYDSPRYSSGLTALHHVYGFITETHMLKPFKQRVTATYDYLMSSVEFGNEHAYEIKQSRKSQKEQTAVAQILPIDWEIDKKTSNTFTFKGYEYGYKKSEVSGEDRLYYDRSKPKDIQMQFFGYMTASKSKSKPKAYILKRGFTAVEDRLRWNGVRLEELRRDTIINVQAYRIFEFETVKQPYEKHYLHFDARVVMDSITLTFRKGDYIIRTGTDKDRFILEMLEPEGPDSYFNWNFFDAVMQQKEHYSDYVFEDKAAEILKRNPDLRTRLDNAKYSESDTKGGMTAEKQIEWVYKQSPYYEKEHNRLPVFKAL